MKNLRTLEEIRAAGAALARDWPPLTAEQVARLRILLAVVDGLETAAGAPVAAPEADQKDQTDGAAEPTAAPDDGLAELRLYTPKQAAAIISGDTPDAVTGWFLEQGCRDGRFACTRMGRRRIFSRENIIAAIAACEVPATARAPKRVERKVG